MRKAQAALLVCSVLAAGCATRSSEHGRTQWLAPAELGAVYSGLDMRVQLAREVEEDTAEEVCGDGPLQAFTTRVTGVGERLAAAAYRRYPELAERQVRFEFTVVPGALAGTFSDSTGALAVLGGSEVVAADDAALAFLLGREMGHVIAYHHDEDSATGLLVSLAAQLLFPVANLLRGGIAVVSSATATATTTALSLAGAKALRAGYRDEQAFEADTIGLELLAAAGWDPIDAAHSLGGQCAAGDAGRWHEEFAASLERLDSLAVGPRRWPAGTVVPAALALGQDGAPD